MHQSNQPLARKIFSITFGLLLAGGVAPCFSAEHATNNENVQSKKYIVHTIRFELGDQGAEKIALRTLKTKSGDVFSRDAISHDLQNVFDTLKVYWKSRPNRPQTDWMAQLTALPSKTSDGQVDILVRSAIFGRPTAPASDRDTNFAVVRQWNTQRVGNFSVPLNTPNNKYLGYRMKMWKRTDGLPLGSTWKHRMETGTEDSTASLVKLKRKETSSYRIF